MNQAFGTKGSSGVSGEVGSRVSTEVPLGAASPAVASAFIGGIVYVWVEAILRYLMTNTTLLNNVVLWNGRAGDVAAFWINMSWISLVAFFGFRYALRKRTYVRTIRFWTIVLTVSAVIAPLLGELGTPWGL